MIRVVAPSRLHFGLFSIPTETASSGPPAAAREFGGVGLMIDKPGVVVQLVSAKAWSATGPLADRAMAFAQEFLRNCPPHEEVPAFTVTVESCAPEHVGLGTGTQLGLAVAKALAVALGRPNRDASFLAHHVGRGRRSAIGVHGFQHGGFLVDGGKKAATDLAPLLARYHFPSDWAILLILPRGSQGVHGGRESAAFAHLAKCAAATSHTDLLCRLVLLGMLPALVERDLPVFGEALYEFNRRVGEMFKPWQGGLYAHPRTEVLVDFFRSQGIRAVGQSSWGPAVFAIAEAARIAELMECCKQFGLTTDEMVRCNANASGAV